MSDVPSRNSEDAGGRLHRCIRDLAALNALPSMCVGRSPDEAVDIVLDALPTALSCDLIYLALPGPPSTDRASLRGMPLSEAQLVEVKAALDVDADAAGALLVPGAGRRWCLEVELPVGTARGRLIAGRATPLDVETDRVLIRSAANLVGTTLEAANVLDSARRKDEFLAMLGHELRNPLGPIVTAIELLGRTPSMGRELTIIDRHTRYLVRLVDDLLDISRVTRGHIELRSEQVSLASVLERALEIAAPLTSRRRHALQVASAGGITLKGDPVRLAQIFANLLTNAAKFTPPGGQLSVEIEPAPGRVRVTVRDNGRGITRDQLRHIFEPFVQVDRKHDALCGGLGLGLAIVERLVKQHGGTIEVHSAGEGCGSAFTVALPTVARVEESVVIMHPRRTSVRSGVRVLVVDDNVDLAELLSEALRIEGFETAVEHDAHAALERWRSFVPHAAVLDLGLPELDGYELARALRAEHGKAPILIAATGYGRAIDRQQAHEAGYDCHFVKPVSVQDIVRTLDQRVTIPAPLDLPGA